MIAGPVARQPHPSSAPKARVDGKGACAAGGAAPPGATRSMCQLQSMFGFSGDIADALRDRTGATPRVLRWRTQTLLVTAQVAVALVLLAGTGLLIRSLSAALSLNAGFETDRLVFGEALLGPYGYTPLRSATLASQLTDRLRDNPTLQSFALTENKGGMTALGRFVIDGHQRQFPSTVSFIAADDRYFTTLGLPVIAGRDFSPSDTASAPLVIIVSESFGRMIANGGDPIGRRITSWVQPTCRSAADSRDRRRRARRHHPGERSASHWHSTFRWRRPIEAPPSSGSLVRQGRPMPRYEKS